MRQEMFCAGCGWLYQAERWLSPLVVRTVMAAHIRQRHRRSRTTHLFVVLPVEAKRPRVEVYAE